MSCFSPKQNIQYTLTTCFQVHSEKSQFDSGNQSNEKQQTKLISLWEYIPQKKLPKFIC